MRYVSIDLETTGLNPETDQILEIGCIIDDLHTGEMGRLRLLLDHERLSGSPEALIMNANLIKEIKEWKLDQNTYDVRAYHDESRRRDIRRVDSTEKVRPVNAVQTMFEWLRDAGYWTKEDHGELPKIVVAGKNVAGFDLPFLRKLFGWGTLFDVRHRVIDPALAFTRRDDRVPPNLLECAVRAKIAWDPKLAHTALGDANVIVQLVRLAIKD